MNYLQKKYFLFHAQNRQRTEIKIYICNLKYHNNLCLYNEKSIISHYHFLVMWN